MYNISKCSYCSHSFVYLRALLTHIDRTHGCLEQSDAADILPNNNDLAARAVERLCTGVLEDRNDEFVFDEAFTETLEPSIIDDSDTSKDDENVSSTKHFQGYLVGPGRIRKAGEPVPPEEELPIPEDRTSLWYPFIDEDEYHFGCWLITNHISKSAIEGYFKMAKASTPGKFYTGRFTSAHTFFKVVDRIVCGLDRATWKEGWTSFQLQEDEIESEQAFISSDSIRTESDKSKVPFYYRDSVKCVEFLLSQRTYEDDMVYVPIQVQDRNNDRVYN